MYVYLCVCVHEGQREGEEWREGFPREREGSLTFCHDAPGSFCIFLVPAQELASSARILGSFYWRRVKKLGSRVFNVTEAVPREVIWNTTYFDETKL